jgi:hypothetical protein
MVRSAESIGHRLVRPGASGNLAYAVKFARDPRYVQQNIAVTVAEDRPRIAGFANAKLHGYRAMRRGDQSAEPRKLCQLFIRPVGAEEVNCHLRATLPVSACSEMASAICHRSKQTAALRERTKAFDGKFGNALRRSTANKNGREWAGARLVDASSVPHLLQRPPR